MTISVCIPTIPSRRRLLMRCLSSVLTQTRPADEIIVRLDPDGRGSAPTRDRASAAATSDWLAFVDDDDELGVDHLQLLENCARETGADLVFPWFTVVGGQDPFPQHFRKVWDPAEPTSTTITFLVRRQIWELAGGFDDGGPSTADWACNDDFRFVTRVNELGAKIVHLPVRTWKWHWHGWNTGGMPWPQRLSQLGAWHEKAQASILAEQQGRANR